MNLARHNEWVWTSRWTHAWLKAAAPGTERESCMESSWAGPLDDAELARTVRAFQRAGINTVLTEGLRNLVRLDREGRTEAVIEALRKAAQACRRAGLRLVHHTTATFASPWLKDIPAADRARLAIDAQTGRYAFVQWKADWAGAGWYLWCLNNPEFRAAYFRLCERYVREAGLDGLMTDEVYFRTGWQACVCPHCRDKFRLNAGITLPAGRAPGFWGRFDNPDFRAWIRFRAASVGDFYRDLRAAIGRAHPHPVLLGCKNQAECPASVPLFGDSNEERMRGVNLLFTELSSPTTSALYSWPRLSVCYMAYNGLSRHYGTPTLAIQYAAPQEAFLSWALRAAHGARVWATSGGGALARHDQLPARPKGLASVKHVFGWESRHDRELAGAIQPLADIGVVLSAATRDMDRSHQGPKGEAWYPYVREWAGWCQRLTGAYLQYAVITEGDLTPAGLRRYALVILPDTTCMSGAACRAVVDYVAGGGALIFTRDAGLYDETGRRDSRTERRLDALGAEIAAAARQRLASGNPTVRFGRHGRGKWAYFANRPGRIVFSEYNRLGAPRIRNVPEMTGVPGDTVRLHEALMMEAVRWAAGESRPLAVRQAPPGLLIKAFGRPAGRPRAVRIHLLNVRGLSAKAGDRIPARSPVTYPPQTEALVLDAAIRAVRQAYVISPDWPGRKPAGIRRLGGVCRVTIPKHTLKRYAVLCLDCGR